MFIIAILAFIAMMVMGMVLGGSLGFYWDIYSAMIVVIPAIVLGIGATSTHSFKLGLALLAGSREQLASDDYQTAAKSFIVIGNSALWVGVIATFIGWVSMGANIRADDFVNAFGPAFAVSILTFMYGAFIKVLCYVAEQKIMFKMAQAG
ncbi:MAG: hypothetical protein VW874_07870 [Gammaproteobacteria bacterium]